MLCFFLLFKKGLEENTHSARIIFLFFVVVVFAIFVLFLMGLHKRNIFFLIGCVREGLDHGEDDHRAVVFAVFLTCVCVCVCLFSIFLSSPPFPGWLLTRISELLTENSVSNLFCQGNVHVRRKTIEAFQVKNKEVGVGRGWACC